MPALREHIEGTGGESGITLRREKGNVAGEGCGIAGNVDDFGGAALSDILDDGRNEPFARRIDDDKIELSFFFKNF